MTPDTGRPRCGECKFAEPCTPPNEYGKRCCRFPPSVTVILNPSTLEPNWYHERPYVGMDEWCGEFVPAPREETDG